MRRSVVMSVKVVRQGAAEVPAAVDESQLGSPFTLASGLFFAAVLWGTIPAAPGLADVSRLVGTPLLGPLVALWFLHVLTHRGRRKVGGGLLLLAGTLISLGAVNALPGSSEMLRVWIGTLIVPLLLFIGIMKLPEQEMLGVRSATRTVLFVTVALGVFEFVRQAGIGSALSLGFAFAHHTDITFWGIVGSQVLGNPNNASVIYCAAFGWAVAERFGAPRGRLSWPFLALSAAAVLSTGSRGATLTAGLIVLAGIAFQVRRGARLFGVLVAAGGLVVAANYWLQQFDPLHQASNRSLDQRLAARLTALPTVFSTPWGTGAGTTADTLSAHLLGIVFSDAAVGSTSHDLFINYGVALGWLGFGLLLVTVVLAVVRGRRFGWLGLLPLFGFFAAGESAGIDVLTPTNPAWSVVMWVLIGLAWRGSVVNPREESEPRSPQPPAEPARFRRMYLGGSRPK